MSRKIKNSAASKINRSLTVVEDTHYHAPKKGSRKPRVEPVAVTLDELLQESGESMEQLKADAEAPAKDSGASNLANTIRSHRQNYRVATKTSGKKTQNNGDYVATVLLDMPLDVLAAYVQSRTGKSYEHLNPGHNRMCCGNHIRAWFKKNDEATLEWLAANAPKPAEAAE